MRYERRLRKRVLLLSWLSWAETLPSPKAERSTSYYGIYGNIAICNTSAGACQKLAVDVCPSTLHSKRVSTKEQSLSRPLQDTLRVDP